jgi:hypothetical protein
MARHADALAAPGIDADQRDRGALTIRRPRLPPARPRTRDGDPQGSVLGRDRAYPSARWTAIDEQAGADAMVTGTISSRRTVMAPVFRCDHRVGSDSR